MYPCRCTLPDPRDFFKYGEMFVEIDPSCLRQAATIESLGLETEMKELSFDDATRCMFHHAALGRCLEHRADGSPYCPEHAASSHEGALEEEAELDAYEAGVTVRQARYGVYRSDMIVQEELGGRPWTSERIMDLVREERISPEDGAKLLELRKELKRGRRHWMIRALEIVLGRS
jgi:hypothetical protein